MPARSVAYVFTGNFSNLTAGLTVASRNVTELGTKMTALDKNGRQMRAGLTSVGNAAGKIGLVAAAGFTVAIGAAANFDKAMSAVQAATHETSSNMEDLRAAAIKAGAATVFSASEAAGAIEELAKAGVSTTDILGGGLSGALNLAAAGSLEVADAAEIAATAMTQFSLGGDQVGHVADLLAAGAGKAQGDVSDLGMALKQSGLVAAQTGLSIDDTVGTLSAFASAGLLGSDAGTSFKTMLQSLTPSSKQAKDEMEKLGISAYDAQGNFVGITNFSGQLSESLSTLSTEQQNASLKIIFGADAVRAASVLYSQGADGIQGWIDKTNDTGYAAETASIKLDNLSGDLEQLKGSLETALIGAGEGGQGPLRSLVQGLTTAVNAFGALPGAAQSTTTALLGITAVTGGALWFGSKVVGGITATKVALESLGIQAATTRSQLALVGTGGAAAALGLGTFIDTLGQLDSMGRSSDAADATVKSFQDLSDALSFSNVGKYADDLHINLGRLTQDLADNGEKGEYAQRVLKDLGDSSHGFGALLKSEAGNTLPFYTDSATKAYDANKDLKSIIDEMPDALAGQSAATGAAAEGTQNFGTAATAAAADNEALNKALQESRKAATEQASAFVGLGDSLNDSKVSLSAWLAQLRKQAGALRDFRVNAERAGKKGLRDGLIAELQAAGPEGALRMKQLAGATEKEIARANRSWGLGQREIRRYTDAVGGVPHAVSTDVNVNTGPALRSILNLQGALSDVRSKSITIAVRRTGLPVRGGTLADPYGSADGSTVPKTGLPYADRHPYMLADGEEVISNRHGQADRHRGLLKAINAGRLADGGSAGSTSVVRAFVTAADARDAARALKEMAAAAKATSNALNRQSKTLDDLTTRRDGLRSSITSGLRSDIFATPEANNPWTSSKPATADPLGALKSDNAQIRKFMADIKTLRARGVTGAALAEALQNPAYAAMLAQLSPAELKSYSSLYGERERLLTSAAVAGSTATGYDQAVSAQTEVVRELTLQNRAQTRAVAAQTKELAAIKAELKKIRGDATSAARSRR